MKNFLFVLIFSYCQLSFTQQLPVRYYKALGTVNYYEGNFLDAVYALQKALSLDPTDREAHQLLASVYDSVGDKNLAQKTRIRMQALKVSFTKKNNEVEVPAIKNDLRHLGNDYYNRGLYDSAVASYSLHLKNFKDDTSALYFLANSYFFLKDYQSAAYYYEQLLMRDRNRPDVYNLIGLCHKAMKDYLKARDYFRQCVIKDSDYVLAYYNLGEVYYELEDFKLAEVNYEKAQKYLPNDKIILMMLGKCYKANQRLDKALDVFQKIIFSDSTYAPASFEAGKIFYEMKHFEKAVKYFQMSLRHDDNPVFRVWLGNSFFELNNFKAALPELKFAADVFPERKDILYKAALAANKLKQYAEAEQYALRAIKVDDRFMPAYEQLVVACKGLKRKKEAQKYRLIVERM